MTNTNIQDIQTRWVGLVPQCMLALKAYPDFDWTTAFHLFSQDTTNYRTALTVVNGNVYYGFIKDLGAARSTKFANLAYVAKELLIQVGGEVSLRTYQGWKGRVPEQGTIDLIIGAYITNRTERLAGARDPDAATLDPHEHQEFIVDAVQDDSFIAPPDFSAANFLAYIEDGCPVCHDVKPLIDSLWNSGCTHRLCVECAEMNNSILQQCPTCRCAESAVFYCFVPAPGGHKIDVHLVRSPRRASNAE
ncbi:unnamed protein product [Brassicogethes aeneus]|uniref:RING-type domain-containing protein n=1 Tax=Brassicogethes aeneus TaxID=1431903 RepID=A0A9P0BH21_BRAAE|nr:unnamed protein product [Brassicogethes aeneus]